MLPNFVKGVFIKSVLSNLKDGDKGSTVLGVVAAGLLAANLDFSKLAGGFSTSESALECGKAGAALILALWAWRIGKKKLQPGLPAA
jgi:hypothetical protein